MLLNLRFAHRSAQRAAVLLVAVLTVPLTIQLLLQHAKKTLAVFSNQLNQSQFSVSAGSQQNPYLLVIFTTFVEEPARRPMHEAVIKNWALLGPCVHPVLFTSNTSSNLTHMAIEYGWDVWPVLRTNKYGTPFIKDMYLYAYSAYNSTFYAYTNGDILFFYNLLHTLNAVHIYFERNKHIFDRRTVFVVGTRSDYSMPHQVPPLFYHPSHIDNFTPGLPLHTGGIDYFITIRDGLPWHSMLDLVIGRAGIDNYLLREAVRWGMNMVDVTETMPVLHMQGKGGTLTHLTIKHPDAAYNKKLMGPKFDYSLCQTGNARFETYLQGSSILLRLRSGARAMQVMPKSVLHKFKKLHFQEHEDEYQRLLVLFHQLGGRELGTKEVVVYPATSQSGVTEQQPVFNSTLPHNHIGHS